MLQKLIISNGSGESSTVARTTSSQLPSLQTGADVQSRRNSASTGFDDVAEEATPQEPIVQNLDNDETVHASNGKASTASECEQPRVRCRRCGYLDGEEQNLLEEEKVEEEKVE